jgi:hypothetical protein
VIRNNFFATPPSFNGTTFAHPPVFANNVGEHADCVPGMTYSHNVLDREPCSDSDVSADVSKDYDASGRLTNARSRVIGAGDPRNSPARDRFRTLRDADPDAGPDEWTVELTSLVALGFEKTLRWIRSAWASG